MPAQTVIQIRRDTAANWESVDPTLAAGEIGFDSTSNQIKIGTGITAWTSLPYASGSASVEVSDTVPADPEVGDVWYNSSEGRSYIYYDDYFVELTPSIQGEPGPAGDPGGITLSVANSGSGAYVINGASNPTLSFIRGHRYVINVNAVGHPFWIQTVSGAYSAGNIYSTGITNNGTENGTIIVEVAFDAPQLYYACQFHSSMQGSITVSDLGPAGSDANTDELYALTLMGAI